MILVSGDCLGLMLMPRIKAAIGHMLMGDARNNAVTLTDHMIDATHEIGGVGHCSRASNQRGQIEVNRRLDEILAIVPGSRSP